MWARMQKDRNKRSRNGGVFNLGDGHGPTEVLTHRGQALGSNVEDGGAEDDGDDLNAEVVDQLHFGGDGARDISPSHPQVNFSRPCTQSIYISRTHSTHSHETHSTASHVDGYASAGRSRAVVRARLKIKE